MPFFKAGLPLPWAALTCLFFCGVSALQGIDVTVEEIEGTTGQTVSAFIRVASGPVDATALQLDLVYDPALFDILSLSTAEAVNDHTVSGSMIAEGLYRIVVASMTNAPLGEGRLVEMGLALKQTPSGSARPFQLTGLVVASPGGQRIAATLVPFARLSGVESGDRFNPFQEIGLTATALDADGSVISVRFLLNGKEVAVDTQAPYAFTWVGSDLGDYLLTVVVTDNLGNQTETDPVPVSLVYPPDYQAWKATYFSAGEVADAGISGFMANADGDVYPNGLEYALGGNPRSADGELISKGVILKDGESYPSIIFRMPVDVTGIQYQVQISHDLQHWLTGVPHTIVERDVTEGAYRRLVYRAAEPISSGKDSFMRILIFPGNL